MKARLYVWNHNSDCWSWFGDYYNIEEAKKVINRWFIHPKYYKVELIK